MRGNRKPRYVHLALSEPPTPTRFARWAIYTNGGRFIASFAYADGPIAAGYVASVPGTFLLLAKLMPGESPKDLAR